jgi:hypothetical protein
MADHPNPAPADQAPEVSPRGEADSPPPDHLAIASNLLGINGVFGYRSGPMMQGLKAAIAAREDRRDTEALRARALAHMRGIAAKAKS